MGWKHYQTLDPRKREPQVARGLFGIRLLILHFKFQFSKSIKSSTFHIFLNLTYPLRKNISFPKCPKITQKFTQNRQTVVMETVEIVRIKMGWKHYKTVDPRKREPQVARGLFGIRLLILHFKFQFSKSIKSSTFHILLNLTYPSRKNISFPKCPKITQKFTQNRQTVVNEISREI